MYKLKIVLVPKDNQCVGYESKVSLIVTNNTTVKNIKNFLKFYLNYHHNANIDNENIIIEYLNEHDILSNYVKDSTELIIIYSLHV